MRQSCFVYDFPSDQIIASWSDTWRGTVSDDGKTLVMSDVDAECLVRRADVYDLPLPVWSPWWSRGTGISLVMLFALMVLKRRVSPTTVQKPSM